MLLIASSLRFISMTRQWLKSNRAHMALRRCSFPHLNSRRSAKPSQLKQWATAQLRQSEAAVKEQTMALSLRRLKEEAACQESKTPRELKLQSRRQELCRKREDSM